jgi:hypothetical protein
MHLGPAGQHADRGPQVGQFSLAILMLAASAAFPETPVVEGERDEPSLSE